jgi:hypothetical protein
VSLLDMARPSEPEPPVLRDDVRRLPARELAPVRDRLARVEADLAHALTAAERGTP